ncbi:MAG: CRISPR-associated protein [Candidatus Poribacteria bacterium]|nr:CRISPR-associated protein [Candidatus Poribacteria bacterium]
MHKELINEAVINLIIEPDGPILIKAGESGADPTRPDMEFVRTYQNGKETIYLPGSSLKGVIRSHAERITRTVDKSDKKNHFSCNPLGNVNDKNDEKGGDYSCNKYFERKEIKEKLKDEFNRGAIIYKDSCFICKMFGNTALSSHIHITDAYPISDVKTERRNGVAIDRVFGSVAVGPFQYETAIEGKFETNIHIKNFTVSQFGLMGLILRDIEEQRVLLGFAKSRGLGRIKANIKYAKISYPMGELLCVEDGNLYGIGKLYQGSDDYNFPANDYIELQYIKYDQDGWCGKNIKLEGMDIGQPLYNLWVECVKRWSSFVKGENEK